MLLRARPKAHDPLCVPYSNQLHHLPVPFLDHAHPLEHSDRRVHWGHGEARLDHSLVAGREGYWDRRAAVAGCRIDFAVGKAIGNHEIGCRFPVGRNSLGLLVGYWRRKLRIGHLAGHAGSRLLVEVRNYPDVVEARSRRLVDHKALAEEDSLAGSPGHEGGSPAVAGSDHNAGLVAGGLVQRGIDCTDQT